MPVPNSVLGVWWVTKGSERHQEPLIWLGRQTGRKEKLKWISKHDVHGERSHHEVGGRWECRRERGPVQVEWIEQNKEAKLKWDLGMVEMWTWAADGLGRNPDVLLSCCVTPGWGWGGYLPFASLRFHSCEMEIMPLSIFFHSFTNCYLMCQALF